jgi:hypothetical protein
LRRYFNSAYAGHPEVAMHQPANLSFERVVHEFARWRAVPERQRSAAPAWWWGPAFEALGLRQPMPATWCASLGLPDGSPIATGAELLLASLGDQTLLPWTGDFPFNARHLNSS